MINPLDYNNTQRIMESHEGNELARVALSASENFDRLTKLSNWAGGPSWASALSQMHKEVSAFEALKNHCLSLSLVDSMDLRATYKDLLPSSSMALHAALMASQPIPWDIRDNLDLSGTAFAHLARLSDLARSPEPYAPSSMEVFNEVLGGPVPFDEDAVDADRDEEAIKAGLNPEVISFPIETYHEVLFSVGFQVRIGEIDPISSERGDKSSIFHPVFQSMKDKIEHHLRCRIETELKRICGEGWDHQRVPSSMRDRWIQRKDADRKARGDSYPLILYADFMDLQKIICREDNWNEVFKNVFPSKMGLQVSFERLNPIRRAIAHTRPLSRADQLALMAEGTRLLSALGIEVWPESRGKLN